MSIDQGGTGGFQVSGLSTAEVDGIEQHTVPLAEIVRELVDATIRTAAPAERIQRARELVEEALEHLRSAPMPPSAGIHVNTEGRVWSWGNAAVGTRNPAAPPLLTESTKDGRVIGRALLRAAQEGGPGQAHGGVLALLLDHVMGETASGRVRPTVTGTLTLRYRRPTMLGPVRIEGWVVDSEGVKTIVHATVADAEGVTVEAEGVFITPRWFRDLEAAASG